MLWRQLVKRHLDAPQRVLDDRVRVGRVAPEFQGWRVQQPPRDEPRDYERMDSRVDASLCFVRLRDRPDWIAAAARWSRSRMRARTSPAPSTAPLPAA